MIRNLRRHKVLNNGVADILKRSDGKFIVILQNRYYYLVWEEADDMDAHSVSINDKVDYHTDNWEELINAVNGRQLAAELAFIEHCRINGGLKPNQYYEDALEAWINPKESDPVRSMRRYDHNYFHSDQP